MLKLDDLQQDMLTELFNLGMGAAAASLSEMINEEVLLSIPNVLFTPKEELTTFLEADSGGHISGVSQRFDGMIVGQALLTFPTDQSLELVKLLLQDSVSAENLSEFEEEALTEVGNILINAGLSSLADVFQDEINSDLPIFSSGSCADVMTNINNNINTHNTILHLQVDFSIENQNIKGYVIYMLDVGSMEKLATSIDTYIKNIM